MPFVRSDGRPPLGWVVNSPDNNRYVTGHRHGIGWMLREYRVMHGFSQNQLMRSRWTLTGWGAVRLTRRWTGARL